MKTHNGLIIERDDGLIAIPADYDECTDCVFHADDRCVSHACFSHQFPDSHECHKHKNVIWINPQ
ncbi:hypothetical protein [Burkholderia cepacia]|uniref:hypothetical protein n=1 Tax=Burkholderia cepacia TaxID=292 RepID=UPI0007598E3B|nr:hypothetical protein [Burkholderia cepacia]KWH50743.1 hypothetical protein WM00_20795 [Burkholderia cepacia]